MAGAVGLRRLGPFEYAAGGLGAGLLGGGRLFASSPWGCCVVGGSWFVVSGGWFVVVARAVPRALWGAAMVARGGENPRIERPTCSMVRAVGGEHCGSTTSEVRD